MNEKSNLDIVTKQVEKKYNAVIRWLGEAAAIEKEVISTGCIGLDAALGIGGLERGMVAEFYGLPGSGKSFLGYNVIKNAVKKGYKAAIVDAERSLDPKLLLKLGLPADRVIVCHGYSGEDNCSVAQQLMKTEEFAVVMIDSVSALVPQRKLEGEFSDATMGIHARLMSEVLPQLTAVAESTNTLLLFINQIRNKIGAYGNPETTTGGNALPFYSCFRVNVRGGHSKSSRLLDESTGEVYGHRMELFIEKNKRSAPYRKASVDLIYGIGYDSFGELIDLGSDLGVIGKGGAWFSYENEKWQGKDAAKMALASNPVLASSIETKIRAIYSGIVASPEEIEEILLEELAVEVSEVDDKSARKRRSSGS